MKRAIKYKIITLFILLDIILIFLFFLNQYNSVKREKFIQTQNQIGKIALDQSSAFYNTQIEILKEGYIDDIQSYIGAIRELSETAKRLHITSIKTIQEINNVLYITAMSVTDEKFKSKEYPLAIVPYVEEDNYLKEIFINSSMEIVYRGDNLIIPLQIKKKRYIILATITNIDILYHLYMIFDSISWIILVLLISFVVIASIFLHVVIENQVLAIYSSLGKFFEYLKSDIKDSNRLEYIKNVSKDELGQISKMINDNIKEIDSKAQTDNKRLIRDRKLIDELSSVLSLARIGDFRGKVENSGDDPRLNQLKDIVNEMLENIDTLLTQLNSTFSKYANSDFTPLIKENNYKAQIEELINNTNTLGQNLSNSLVIRAKNLIRFYGDSRSVDDFIKNSNTLLKDSLNRLNQISIDLESNLKFGLEFNHSIEVLKKENRYINNQLDTLGSRYAHLDRRDIKVIDDTIKDIRYSLQLFDKNIDKFSLSTVPSSNSTKESIEILKEELNSKLVESKKIEEITKKFIHSIDDIKVEIIENSEFIGKDRVKTYILYKWEVMDV